MAVKETPKITTITIGGKLHMASVETQESRVPDRAYVPKMVWHELLTRLGVDEPGRWVCVPTGLRAIDSKAPMKRSTWRMFCFCGKSFQICKPSAELDKTSTDCSCAVLLEPFSVMHPGIHDFEAVMVVGQCSLCRRIYWGQLADMNKHPAFLLESEYIGMAEAILSKTLRRLE